MSIFECINFAIRFIGSKSYDSPQKKLLSKYHNGLTLHFLAPTWVRNLKMKVFCSVFLWAYHEMDRRNIPLLKLHLPHWPFWRAPKCRARSFLEETAKSDVAIDAKTICPIAWHFSGPMPFRDMRGHAENAYVGYFVDMGTYAEHIWTLESTPRWFLKLLATFTRLNIITRPWDNTCMR